MGTLAHMHSYSVLSTVTLSENSTSFCSCPSRSACPLSLADSSSSRVRRAGPAESRNLSRNGHEMLNFANLVKVACYFF